MLSSEKNVVRHGWPPRPRWLPDVSPFPLLFLSLPLLIHLVWYILTVVRSATYIPTNQHTHTHHRS